MRIRLFDIFKLLIVAIVTVCFYYLAYLQRGYFAGIIGGGETFVPITLIFVFWFIPKYFKE